MNKPMTGQEIAKELGISRQAVSFTLRKSMAKMYYEVMNQGFSDSPFDTIQTLSEMLQINMGDEADIKEFVSLFPEEIQEEVKADARRMYNVIE
jgi:DNA-binding transcriptional regulator GbsR (MarR family)